LFSSEVIWGGVVVVGVRIKNAQLYQMANCNMIPVIGVDKIIIIIKHYSQGRP